MRKYVVTLIAVSLTLAVLVSWLGGAFKDEPLEAVMAHPMASPSFSVGEVTYQRAQTGRVASVALFSRTPKYTEARTSISADEDEIEILFGEIKTQAEDLGYQFEEGVWSFEVFARPIPEYPNASITIAKLGSGVSVTVHQRRGEQ